MFHWFEAIPGPAGRVSQIRVGVTGVYGSGVGGAAVSALPEASTAAQNDAEGHDTDVMSSVPSPMAGDDHDEPSQLRIPPELSTAVQNVADGHETEVRL